MWKSLEGVAANQTTLNEGMKGHDLRGGEQEGGSSLLSPHGMDSSLLCPCLLCPCLSQQGRRDAIFICQETLLRPPATPVAPSEPFCLLSSLRRKGRAGKTPASRKTKTQSEQETAQGHTTSPRVELDAGPPGLPPPFSPPDCT